MRLCRYLGINVPLSGQYSDDRITYCYIMGYGDIKVVSQFSTILRLTGNRIDE